MNNRLLALAGALVSIAFVIGLLVPVPGRQPEMLSRPTTEDRGAAGLAGARAWLEARDVRTDSLRVRYDGLDDAAGPASGNLLILHLPRLRAARPDEVAALRRWLRRGNTAVVLAALAHVPAWARQSRQTPERGLDQLELPAFRVEGRGRGTGRGDDERARLTPYVRHPLTAGIDALATTTSTDRVQGPDQARTPWLGLFGRDDDTAVLWRSYGDGGILVSAHADLFGNDPLREAYNAQLLANLVQQRVAGEGRVVFDDFHLGLSRLYDAEAFFADPRLHATLAFLVVFWLLYVVGHDNRLAPLHHTPTPPSTRAFTEAVGGMLARRCDRRAVGRELLAHFFDGVRRRQGLPENGRPAWDCLRTRAEIPAADIDRLERMARRLAQDRRVPLQRLTRLIAHIEENLR